MGLQSSDLLLVERSNTLYKETFGNRANIDSTDLLLVERSNTIYKCTYANWSNANSTDLILVERSNTLYKETKANWDAATTTNQDIYTSNYSPNIVVNYTSATADSTANFNVLSLQVAVTGSGSSEEARLYIGQKNTAPTSWQGDFCIAAVQILQSNGTSFRTGTGYTAGYDWNFGNGNSTYGYGDWGTTQAEITNESSNPWTYSYHDIGSSSSTRRWAAVSGTSSSYVGADGGVWSPSGYSGGGGSILPEGTANIAQSSSTTEYLFAECSGTDTGDFFWLESPEITVHNGDIIRLCYGGTNGQNSTTGLQAADTLRFRFG
mgnify:FL=1|tara:strand:+ start:579 stop:1541 length:963 start_codon:yes stop_codon:yes gene_type:complete